MEGRKTSDFGTAGDITVAVEVPCAFLVLQGQSSISQQKQQHKIFELVALLLPCIPKQRGAYSSKRKSSEGAGELDIDFTSFISPKNGRNETIGSYEESPARPTDLQAYPIGLSCVQFGRSNTLTPKEGPEARHAQPRGRFFILRSDQDSSFRLVAGRVRRVEFSIATSERKVEEDTFPRECVRTCLGQSCHISEQSNYTCTFQVGNSKGATSNVHTLYHYNHAGCVAGDSQPFCRRWPAHYRRP